MTDISFFQEQKRCVSILEEDVTSAKKMYAEALHNLEAISDEIHQQRVEKRMKEELGVRGAGVGSESPSPPPVRDKGTTIIIDGSTVPHTSSCSTASTTFTTSHTNDPVWSDCKAFTLPSVIHESPESARRRSYRDAIESRLTQSLDLNSVMECENLNLDDEYMTLPCTRPTKTSKRRTRNRSESEISSVDSRTDEEEIFSGTVLLDVSSSSSQNRSRTDSEMNDTSTSESISSPSSGSQRSSKLQGLILKIDRSMDPSTQYTRRMKQVSNKNNSKNNIESQPSQARPASYPYKRSATVPVDTHPLQETNFRRNLQSPTSSVMSDLSETRDSERGSIRLQSETDEMSDNDSIVSSGQMLDDDQVGILTLDFSDDLTIKRPFQRQEWSRMSLPPRLSYLENYFKHRAQIQKIHPESVKEDENSQNSCGITNQ